jgi:UDP-glucose 4-epimerase
VLDDLSRGRHANIATAAASGRVRVIVGDIRQPGLVDRLTEGVDVVFHQAALRSVPRSVEDPLAYHDVNATGTMRLLLAARDAGVRRLVFASSSSVYGDQPVLPLHEEMRPDPVSPYGASKLIGEHYCANFTRHYGVETVALRYFNVYGPRQNAGSPYSGVISLFITSLLSGRTPVVYGDGQQSRDFTYVDDVVQGNLRALRARGLQGQHVNVATGHRVSLKTLLDTLGKELGVAPRPEYRKTRAGDIRHSLADISGAYKLLGYRPRVDFETGLRRTLDWYRGKVSGRRARRS